MFTAMLMTLLYLTMKPEETQQSVKLLAHLKGRNSYYLKLPSSSLRPEPARASLVQSANPPQSIIKLLHKIY